MSVTLAQLGLYAGALLVLFLTPGPVWVAVLARGISGGYWAVVPLTLGVMIGDVIWPLVAIFGITAITSVYAGFLTVLRWVGAAFFVLMGLALIRHADKSITENKALTAPGFLAGFSAGLLAIAANPKAVLFYLGLLPGFFSMGELAAVDIVVICLISAVIPLAGNLMLAGFMGYVRQFLASPKALYRTNFWAGIAMIGVGVVIGLAN